MSEFDDIDYMLAVGSRTSPSSLSPCPLQELVAVSGWDGFLALRSAVFVMHADSEVLRQQQQVGRGLLTQGARMSCSQFS